MRGRVPSLQQRDCAKPAFQVRLRPRAKQLSFLILLCTAACASASVETRPALLGRHPRSLINVIHAETMVKRGQGDALMMFTCAIDPLGQGYGLQIYRETEGSGPLKRHLLDCYQRALFIPAIYHGQPTTVIMFGTVIFAVVNGKPHVRIFLNQEEADLRAGSDFIAPQVAFAPGHRFKGLVYPPGVKAAGAVAAAVDVDLSGKVTNARVIAEHPPGLGFGAQVVGGIRDAPFIPGFRNGKPVACRFTMPVVFIGPTAQWKTGPRGTIVGRQGGSRTGHNFPADPKP